MAKVNDIYVIGNNQSLFTMIQEQIGEEFELLNLLPRDLKQYAVHLVIVLKTENESPLDITQHILSEHPKATIIYISDEANFELLRDLTRLGVTDYFVLPDEAWLFSEKAINVAEKKFIDVGTPTGESDGFIRGGGTVFTFYSGKGGSGKSLVSSAFAQTLKLESTAKVLYIDLNLQYGGSETFLGIDSNRSIIDLIPVIHELNEHHIRNVAEKERYSDMDVLISPRDAEMAEKIDEEFILRLIRSSKRSYDFIVIDIPGKVEERVYTALTEADHIYYVMNLDTLSIRILKGVETLFRQLGIMTEEQMELVMNFTGRDNELTKKDIERFYSYPITAEVRRDHKGVQSLMNKGEPMRKEFKEKRLPAIAKDIRKWVRSMLK